MTDESPTAMPDQFIEAMEDGLDPMALALKLGISPIVARKWSKGLLRLSRAIVMDGTPFLDGRGRPPTTGITLIYSADKLQAFPGEMITFAAWVMNDTDEPLHDIAIIRRSFTNAGLENLTYATEPDVPGMRLGSLPAGEVASITFTYRVTERDLWYGGELISALGVQATTAAGVPLWDECDAGVTVKRQPQPCHFQGNDEKTRILVAQPFVSSTKTIGTALATSEIFGLRGVAIPMDPANN
ncbi:hypothetical protein ACFRJ9_19610 [Paenarthrobacter sp. NPDC056912]|uniref:hypothetical protein n=1 Tax=Paenarthrobacter sp. NPDC056912 TaxID=3345965 RepID=UPI003671025A